MTSTNFKTAPYPISLPHRNKFHTYLITFIPSVKKNILTYFVILSKNREEVFEAVLDSLVKEVVQEIQRAMDSKHTIHEKIEAFCQTKIKTSEAKKPFFTAIEVGMNAAEKSKHTQAMGLVHQQLMKAETQLLSEALILSTQRQEIRQLTTIEHDSFIFILLSGIRGIKREMLLKNSFKGLNETIHTLVDMTERWLR